MHAQHNTLSHTGTRTLQDVVAGDGTTSVTVICGALLSKCLILLDQGVHPTLVSESFQTACDKAVEVLKNMATPVDLKDRDSLIHAAMTCASLSFCLSAQHENFIALQCQGAEPGPEQHTCSAQLVQQPLHAPLRFITDQVRLTEVRSCSVQQSAVF